MRRCHTHLLLMEARVHHSLLLLHHHHTLLLHPLGGHLLLLSHHLLLLGVLHLSSLLLGHHLLLLGNGRSRDRHRGASWYHRGGGCDWGGHGRLHRHVVHHVILEARLLHSLHAVHHHLLLPLDHHLLVHHDGIMLGHVRLLVHHHMVLRRVVGLHISLVSGSVGLGVLLHLLQHVLRADLFLLALEHLDCLLIAIFLSFLNLNLDESHVAGLDG
mmetsp:Transcript_33747/g.52098  ORF Transcript_33747/g.52098 Transcript_33747/m.52098 type:complete len:215 (-) Transcript_33747:2446-3090(-)